MLGLVVLLSACAVDKPGVTEWQGTVDRHGDTTVVTTKTGTVWQHEIPARLPEPVPVWQSEVLAWPGAIVQLAHDTIAVADKNRIHVVGANGTLVRTIGRKGKGPGEFISIMGVGRSGGDTLLVWDGALMRLTWITSAGAFIRSATLTPHSELLAARPIDLVVLNDGVILAWYAGFVDPGGPPQIVALSWMSTEGDSTFDVARLAGFAYARTQSGVVVPKDLFGPAAHYAVSADGRVAYTEGVDYCVRIRKPSRTPVMRVCRDWQRAKVTGNVTDPDIPALAAAVNLPKRGQRLLAERLRVQTFADRKNSIDEMRFDSAGRLWVRVVDRNQKYDPMLMGPYPELRPRYFMWDVFAPNGRLLTEVELSSRFDPRLLTDRQLVGVYELPTGERVVARVELPTRFEAN